MAGANFVVLIPGKTQWKLICVHYKPITEQKPYRTGISDVFLSRRPRHWAIESIQLVILDFTVPSL